MSANAVRRKTFKWVRAARQGWRGGCCGVHGARLTKNKRAAASATIWTVAAAARAQLRAASCCGRLAELTRHCVLALGRVGLPHLHGRNAARGGVSYRKLKLQDICGGGGEG